MIYGCVMHWTKKQNSLRVVWNLDTFGGIGWLWLKEAANSAQQVAAPTMPGWHAEVCGWLWDRRCNFDMSKLFFTHVFTTFWTVKWCNQYATLQVSLQFFTILLWLSPFWCILYPVILHILVISCHLRRETSPRKIVAMRPLRGGGVLWEALPDRHQGGQGHVCLLERGAYTCQ